MYGVRGVVESFPRSESLLVIWLALLKGRHQEGAEGKEEEWIAAVEKSEAAGAAGAVPMCQCRPEKSRRRQRSLVRSLSPIFGHVSRCLPPLHDLPHILNLSQSFVALSGQLNSIHLARIRNRLPLPATGRWVPGVEVRRCGGDPEVYLCCALDP